MHTVVIPMTRVEIRREAAMVCSVHYWENKMANTPEASASPPHSHLSQLIPEGIPGTVQTVQNCTGFRGSTGISGAQN